MLSQPCSLCGKANAGCIARLTQGNYQLREKTKLILRVEQIFPKGPTTAFQHVQFVIL
jgi:hypothetical protein